MMKIATILACIIAVTIASRVNYSTFNSADCSGERVEKFFNVEQCYQGSSQFLKFSYDGSSVSSCVYTDSQCENLSEVGCSKYEDFKCIKDGESSSRSYAHFETQYKTKDSFSVLATNTTSSSASSVVFGVSAIVAAVAIHLL